MGRSKVKFPCECGGILLNEVLVSFGDAVGVEASVTVRFPFWIVPPSPDPVSENGAVDDGMCNVDVLGPKLFVQALA